MQYWLMKSEPGCYSIDTLKKDRVTPWDGVRNYQVRNMMRDEMKTGDMAFMYHSNAGKETGVAGEMEVVHEAKVDVTQFDPKDEHFDPKAKKENPRWYCPDLGFVSKFDRIVTLEELKSEKVFEGSKLTQKGNRLSVVPLTKRQYDKVCKLAKQ